MIFRQLFDHASSTYTYLLGGAPGGEALIIDPVLERVERYIQLLGELDLRLVKALDTHVHADHVTGLGALRDRTRCVTVMGAESEVDVVSVRVVEGDPIDIEGVSLEAMHTPGHTGDSYCYRMADRVFAGDTLLIRGTGRTDFCAAQSVADQAWCLECADAAAEMGRADAVLVDLREEPERRRDGLIPGSLHAPYGDLERFLSPGGILHYEGKTARKRLVYYCAFGERSALAVKTSQEMGLGDVCHIVGGMDAWSRYGGAVEEAG